MTFGLRNQALSLIDLRQATQKPAASVLKNVLDTADIVRDGDVTPTTGDTTSTVLDATPNDHQPLLTANV